MANPVNPPPQLRMPKAFTKDPEVRAYEEQRDVILFQLWQRTGGNEDFVEESQQDITSSSSRVSRNAARINSLELKAFEIVFVTTDFTTRGNQILICKNVVPIEITLDPDAIEEDELHIKRRGESIEEIGLIDGLTNRIINVLQWSDHLVFDGIDWSAI